MLTFVWYRKQRDYDVNSLELHKEILKFCDNISPKPCETVMRNEVVQRVSTVIQNRWPRAEVKVFGSFNTGLYLPMSDIDIVVFGNFPLSICSLGYELRLADIATPGSLSVLDKASVPIIKFEDKRTEVKVDISVNMNSGIKSAEKVKAFLKQYPLLDKMILVIKQFLYQRNLNEVYSGGIGSYSVVLLIVSFFQHCCKCDMDDGNLGVLLTKFFELYGKEFDYAKNGIQVDGNGSYFNKCFESVNTLLIKDPADPTNIIKGAWNIWKVKCAFRDAHDSLSFVLSNSSGCNYSFLGLIVSVPDKVVRYRKWVEEEWGRALSTHHSNQSPATSFLTMDYGSTTFDKKLGYKMARIFNLS